MTGLQRLLIALGAGVAAGVAAAVLGAGLPSPLIGGASGR